jgi:hypothetical protein
MNSQNQLAPVGAFQRSLLLIMLAVIVAALSISSQSFWIDEAGTAAVARQSTPALWWKALLDDRGSTTQMPFFMIYAWVWEKIFGSSEWWLRAANFPWLAVGLLAIPRRQFFFICAVVISPFVWYYLSEFRPYAMQLGATLLIFGSLWRLAKLPGEQKNGRQEKFLAAVFCFGLVMLSGSSLLGMVWAGAILVMVPAILGGPDCRRLWRGNWSLLMVTALPLLALTIFYPWVLKQGSSPTPGSTGMGNTLFTFYELLGFAGLGPGRTLLRVGGIAPLRPFIPLLALHAALTACLLFFGARYIIRNVPRRVWVAAATALGAAAIFLLAVGVGKHFRVLGRHFSPLEPALLLVLACGLRESWSRGNFWRALAMVSLLLTLGSALELRFAARHVRDDYRTAAAIAITANARSERVWWCADGNAALYYQVPLSPWGSLAAPGQVWQAIHPPAQMLTNQPPPDLVILSKPDLYDDNGLMCSYLAKHHYLVRQTLPSFTLWRKNAD